MHTMNKKSWHYKLATAGKDPWELEYFDEECDNFCKYARSVMNGMLRYAGLAMAVLLGVGLVAYTLGDFIGWILWMIFNVSTVEPGIGAMFVIVILGLATIMFVSKHTGRLIVNTAHKVSLASHKAARKIEKKESGFLKLLYTKYKEKVCFGVNYK